MSVTVNGTEGITLDNGSADGAQVTLASSGYSNWNLDNYSGRFRAYYNATEYFTINSSGNVGIGTSSLSAKLNVTGTSVVANIESTNNNNVMGILFNGSVGGYIGASASTLQFSNSSGTGVAAINSTNFQFNSGYGSVATAYGCRAWVNFNGTGTVAIRASGNVTSITDNGTGDYTVNFTNAMPDANYSVVCTSTEQGSTDNDLKIRSASAPTTTTVRLFNVGSTFSDPTYANVAVFR